MTSPGMTSPPSAPVVVDGWWSTPCLECEGTKVFHEPDGAPHTCWACKGMGWVPATPVAPVDDCQHIYLPAGPHENRDQCVTHGRVWPCPGRDWYGVMAGEANPQPPYCGRCEWDGKRLVSRCFLCTRDRRRA